MTERVAYNKRFKNVQETIAREFERFQKKLQPLYTMAGLWIAIPENTLFNECGTLSIAARSSERRLIPQAVVGLRTVFYSDGQALMTVVRTDGNARQEHMDWNVACLRLLIYAAMLVKNLSKNKAQTANTRLYLQGAHELVEFELQRRGMDEGAIGQIF